MEADENRRLTMVIGLSHHMVQLQECGLLHCDTMQNYDQWVFVPSISECGHLNFL